jgi:hypothetical protein
VVSPLRVSDQRRIRSASAIGFADPQKSFTFSVVVSVNDVTFTFGFVRRRVTLELLRRRTHGQVSQGAAEDINVVGDRQPFLPWRIAYPAVDWDLNYLRAKENVTCGEV